MGGYNISIIIPHYNIPELLAKLIDSIPVRNDIQIIIVDDNSTNNVEELEKLISSYSGRNVEFYRNETGKNSPGTCRNIGLEHAKGKWILFADADDYYVDGWYEKLTPYFASNIELLYFKPTSINLKTGLPDTRHVIFASAVEKFCSEPNRKNELKLKFESISIVMCMYSREMIERGNIRFGNTVRAEDTMFVISCGYEAKTFKCLNDTIYCITRRDGSITASFTPDYFDQHIKTRITKYKYLQNRLSRTDIMELEVECAGLKVMREVRNNISDKKERKAYRKLLKEARVPLVMWKCFNPFRVAKQALRLMLWKHKMNHG